jgi:hypothetical protein
VTIKIEGSAEGLALLFDQCLSSVVQNLSFGADAEAQNTTDKVHSESVSSVLSSSRLRSARPSGPKEPTKAESFWGSAVPSSEPKVDLYQEQALKERAESGGVAWYHLVSEWSQNFGVEGEQPDRAKIVTDTMNDHGRDVIFYVRQQGGLTRCVRSVAPHLSKKESRLIAENIASVSSALGIALSDFLEYDQETRSIKNS